MLQPPPNRFTTCTNYNTMNRPIYQRMYLSSSNITEDRINRFCSRQVVKDINRAAVGYNQWQRNLKWNTSSTATNKENCSLHLRGAGQFVMEHNTIRAAKQHFNRKEFLKIEKLSICLTLPEQSTNQVSHRTVNHRKNKNVRFYTVQY